MSQPSFSYHFESDRSIEEVWALMSDLEFWQQSWKGLFKRLTLVEPIRLGSRGILALSEGENWELLITDFRPARALTLQMRSQKGKITLDYLLEQKEALVITVVTKLEHSVLSTDAIVSSLINPILTKHFNLLHSLLVTSPKTPSERKQQEHIDTQIVDADPLLAKLDVQAGFRLWQLANLWQSKVRAILKPYQLTPTQWLLLYALVRLEKHSEPITPSILAGLLELNTMLVSDVIKALVKKHLVHKIKILPDRRSFVISATPDGKITAVEAHASIVQADKKFFSPEPLSAIRKLLLPT